MSTHNRFQRMASTAAIAVCAGLSIAAFAFITWLAGRATAWQVAYAKAGVYAWLEMPRAIVTVEGASYYAADVWQGLSPQYVGHFWAALWICMAIGAVQAIGIGLFLTRSKSKKFVRGAQVRR